MMKEITPNAQCPCGSGKIYKDCCGDIISGFRPAATALELMRSRYTAFTIANGAYLMRSWHSRFRKPADRREIEQWASSVQWMGLTILETVDGEENDQKGIVEFRAVFADHGKLDQIHERSLFYREKGLWVYYSAL